jgi:cytoskeleton protein RodZ
MTLEEVSDQTKIPLSSLECIESDRFNELPNAIVVKGFIKSVCRVLQLDESRILEGYRASLGEKGRDESRVYAGSLSGEVLKPKNNKYRFVLALIIFLIFGSLLMLVVFTPSNLRGSEKLSGAVDKAMDVEK